MGNALLKELVEATGLPAEWVMRELARMLTDAGIDPNFLTLEQMRDFLAKHIGEALLQAKEDSFFSSDKYSS